MQDTGPLFPARKKGPCVAYTSQGLVEGLPKLVCVPGRPLIEATGTYQRIPISETSPLAGLTTLAGFGLPETPRHCRCWPVQRRSRLVPSGTPSHFPRERYRLRYSGFAYDSACCEAGRSWSTYNLGRGTRFRTCRIQSGSHNGASPDQRGSGTDPRHWPEPARDVSGPESGPCTDRGRCP